MYSARLFLLSWRDFSGGRAYLFPAPAEGPISLLPSGKTMKKHSLILLVALCAAPGCRNTTSLSPRPDTWATRAEVPAFEGMNFYQVDKNLYRGSQPTAAQVK